MESTRRMVRVPTLLGPVGAGVSRSRRWPKRSAPASSPGLSLFARWQGRNLKPGPRQTNVLRAVGTAVGDGKVAGSRARPGGLENDRNGACDPGPDARPAIVRLVEFTAGCDAGDAQARSSRVSQREQSLACSLPLL